MGRADEDLAFGADFGGAEPLQRARRRPPGRATRPVGALPPGERESVLPRRRPPDPSGEQVEDPQDSRAAGGLPDGGGEDPPSAAVLLVLTEHRCPALGRPASDRDRDPAAGGRADHQRVARLRGFQRPRPELRDHRREETQLGPGTPAEPGDGRQQPERPGRRFRFSPQFVPHGLEERPFQIGERFPAGFEPGQRLDQRLGGVGVRRRGRERFRPAGDRRIVEEAEQGGHQPPGRIPLAEPGAEDREAAPGREPEGFLRIAAGPEVERRASGHMGDRARRERRAAGGGVRLRLEEARAGEFGRPAEQRQFRVLRGEDHIHPAFPEDDLEVADQLAAAGAAASREVQEQRPPFAERPLGGVGAPFDRDRQRRERGRAQLQPFRRAAAEGVRVVEAEPVESGGESVRGAEGAAPLQAFEGGFALRRRRQGPGAEEQADPLLRGDAGEVGEPAEVFRPGVERDRSAVLRLRSRKVARAGEGGRERRPVGVAGRPVGGGSGSGEVVEDEVPLRRLAAPVLRRELPGAEQRLEGGFHGPGEVAGVQPPPGRGVFRGAGAFDEARRGTGSRRRPAFGKSAAPGALPALGRPAVFGGPLAPGRRAALGGLPTLGRRVALGGLSTLGRSLGFGEAPALGASPPRGNSERRGDPGGHERRRRDPRRAAGVRPERPLRARPAALRRCRARPSRRRHSRSGAASAGGSASSG